MSATEWSELGVSGLPTGTVTLLLADVEGSTRLWETEPKEMAAAIARRDGIRLQTTEAAAANLLNLSEQVPARVPYMFRVETILS